MIKKNRWFILIVLAFVAFYFWRYKIPPSIDQEVLIIELPSGERTALNEAHDGPLLVNFYASWCGPCMNEMESLQKAHDKGLFTVVGLTDDSQEKIAAVRERYKLSFPMYRLVESLKDHGIYSIPTSYLINAKGEVIKSMTGPQDWDSPAFMNKAADRLSFE